MPGKTAAPLAGIRVIDMADASAALATRRLADLGAEVIKIEPPEGDAARRHGPFAGIEGVFRERKGEDRALLLMSMLGTTSTVEVDLMLLQKAI